MTTNVKKEKQPPPKKIAADRASSTASASAMIARGKLIAKVAPQSALWTNNPVIQQTGNDAIAAAATVEADAVAIEQAELQLGAAKDKEARDKVTCTSKLNLFFTAVEDTATTPKEMQDLAVEPQPTHNYGLASPLDLKVTSDPELHNIAAQVKRAPGMKRCIIEFSSDLTMATGVKPFPGDGARQKIGPLPPGTYAVRACHIRAADRSGYTEILTVVVK